MNNKLDYNISDRYNREIGKIDSKLNQLENKRVYELNGSMSDGSLETNIEQLREMIGDLLDKIQNDRESMAEEIGRHMSKLQKK